LLLDQKKNSKNDEEVYKVKAKMAIELKILETKLIHEAKNKFRYIVGHNKQESQPGVFLEDYKVAKNIRQRIIMPSERIN
jgi:hypothetical protein